MADHMDPVPGDIQMISAVHQAIRNSCICFMHGDHKLGHLICMKFFKGIFQQFL